MGKLVTKARQLLEDMTLNNYHWASEKGYSKKVGRHKINAFTMPANKDDALL